VAELGSARRLIDVGSGLGAPAARWKSAYGALDISCININFQQLLSTRCTGVSLLNATSAVLPFSDKSADRIVALESAQHFRPLDRFVKECRRVIQPGGLLVVAIPVMTRAQPFFKLGILSWTWSSERYKLEYVKSTIEANGFAVQDIRHIGHHVYEPLTE
jgi:ubiquinone/menaquinone biosynthesis C-methylase UbiE